MDVLAWRAAHFEMNRRPCTRPDRRLVAPVVVLARPAIGVRALRIRSARDAPRLSGDAAAAPATATPPRDSGPAPTGQRPTARGSSQGRSIRLPEQAPGRRS